VRGSGSRRFALVAGGGTAGHVVPAVSVARCLVDRRGAGAVELVGARRGLEARTPLVGDLPVTLLPGRGLQRRMDRGAWAANLRAVAELAAAVGIALGLVWRRRPAVVVSVGGYASVPVALAATVLGVPVVVVNVDAVPGLANRLVGRVARASAVAYPGSGLPRAVVTGPPVRPEIVEAAAAAQPGSRVETPEEVRQAARQALGLPGERTVVVVVGGSLGARRVNEAVLELAGLWVRRADLAIYHVVGQRDADWAAAEGRRRGLLGADDAPDSGPGAPPAGRSGARDDHADRLWYRQVPYEERMALAYQAADVVVGRAGAMTVAELTVVGVPAVLVPLPGAPGDHQTANARVLADAGAAQIVTDGRCDGATLAEVLEPLVADRDRRAAMATAAGRLGRADAADSVAAVVEAHACARRSRS